jgi:hypothetical protein
MSLYKRKVEMNNFILRSFQAAFNLKVALHIF